MLVTINGITLYQSLGGLQFVPVGAKLEPAPAPEDPEPPPLEVVQSDEK